MRFDLLCVCAMFLVASFVSGCGEKSATNSASTPSAPSAASSDDAKFSAAIAKLPEEDRAAATAQKFCAIENTSRLGSMGMPHKVMVDGQAVFLCCAGCEEEALKDPQKTLAKVDELKAAAKSHD